jgi:hypothetical protein
VVPTYNEAVNLEASVMRLRYLDESFALRAMVTIVALLRFSLPRGWAFRPTSATADLQAAGAPLSSQ